MRGTRHLPATLHSYLRNQTPQGFVEKPGFSLRGNLVSRLQRTTYLIVTNWSASDAGIATNLETTITSKRFEPVASLFV